MSAPMDQQRLAEILARAEEAAPGPWESDGAEIYGTLAGVLRIDLWVGETLNIDDLPQANANASFIAAARSDVPDLVAEVQRLWAERHSTNEALDDAVRENAKLRARVAELEQTLERRTELLRDVQKIARKRTNESRGRREYGALLKAENAELKAAAQKVAKFCAARAEYITNLRNCNPDNGHDYDRWQGHAEARRQLSQLLGLPVGWPAEDKPAPVPLPRQTEDPHDGPNHHDYALGRDLPTIPRQTTGRCPQGHTFEDCTCGGAR